jgi:ACR3 family arsenite transporter
MSVFERWLSLWVGLAIVGGVAAGLLFPEPFAWIAQQSIAEVNLVIASLIWAMIYPMMVQVDWASVRQASREPKGLGLTLVVNWLIKPLTMAGMGVLFFDLVYADWVDAKTAQEVIAGMILLGVAPCTAMVFVWSQLVRGHAAYTVVQVSINDLVLILAFAPIAGLLLGVTDVTVPWQTLLLSTLLFVALPLVAGVLTRLWLLKAGRDSGSTAEQSSGSSADSKLERFLEVIKPFSMLGLILTVLILFGLQAETILAQPLLMALIALPLILQTYGIFFLSWFMAKRLRLAHPIAGPACLIGTSNFFELAVAVAISLFGLQSAAALATVVGVLVEVPVMLTLVALVNRWRPADQA